jgi:hypothetical protein
MFLSYRLKVPDLTENKNVLVPRDGYGRTSTHISSRGTGEIYLVSLVEWLCVAGRPDQKIFHTNGSTHAQLQKRRT